MTIACCADTGNGRESGFASLMSDQAIGSWKSFTPKKKEPKGSFFHADFNININLTKPESPSR